MKTIMIGVAAWALCASTLLAAPEETLRIGDAAPALENVDWIKGEAIREFERGHVYVLDFWATWCGPCVRSIPHINELAKVRRDDKVTVIGLAIWPTETMTPTAEYVADRGDEMDYTIAADIEGKTAAAYMEATGQQGIPTAMVIDQQGTLVWIGHPMSRLDEVVASVVEGTFNLEEEAERRESEEREAEQLDAEMKAAIEKAKPLQELYGKAMEAKKWETVANLAEEISAIHANFITFDVYRYQALVRLDGEIDPELRTTQASDFGGTLTAGRFNESPELLNFMAWWIVDPENDVADDVRDLDLAMLAAERADELTEHRNPGIIDTLARVHFRQGNIDRALELQAKAVELAQGNEELHHVLNGVLEEYREAAEQG